MLRPSKTFLFEALAREVGRRRGGFGLDAASAQMKNRWMFKTDVYVALDIDQEALRKGMERYGADPGVRALRADLTGPIDVPTGFFDLVVSTNTLSHLAPAPRGNAVAELSRVTAPEGVMLAELGADDADSKRRLEDAFKDVRAIYFKNPLSRAYEALFERNGWLGTHPVAGSRPFLLLSWLIGRFEYLTRRSASLNARVLYVCGGKRDATRPAVRDRFNAPTAA